MAVCNGFPLLLFCFLIFATTSTAQSRNKIQKLRPNLGFEDFALSTTRGFGKRTADLQFLNKIKSPPDIEWAGRQQRGLHEMNIPVARGFGKRASSDDIYRFKNFLLDWFELERKLMDLRMDKENDGIQEEND